MQNDHPKQTLFPFPVYTLCIIMIWNTVEAKFVGEGRKVTETKLKKEKENGVSVDIKPSFLAHLSGICECNLEFV